MENKITAVIFDLDGVIVCTDECHYRAWKKMADAEGIYFDRVINNRLRGVSRMESLNIVLERANKTYTDAEKEKMAALKNEYYKEYIKALTPDDILPGVADNLKRLKDSGIKIAIGSSSKNTPIILKQIGLDNYFDAVSDGNNIKNSKPDPEVFLKAAQMLNIAPQNCMIVEDADAGIEAGKRAGMATLAVGGAKGGDYTVKDLSDGRIIIKTVYKHRAHEIVKSLTLKQKIGQLNQEPLGRKNADELREKIRRGEIGSVILACSATAGNDEQYRGYVDFINDIQRTAVEESEAKIPIIFGRDVIHGHRTVMPIPLAQTATFNPELAKKAYRCVAKEAANDGVHWSFSPMIDISRDPRWGRCIEGIGEDPHLGGKMAAAVTEGFQGEDYSAPDSLAACAKHYIGYGAVEGGRDYNLAEISDYTLRNVYLKTFKAAVEAGIATVMNSFNAIGGDATASSRYLLTDLLKEELGFDGYVVSDWATIERLIAQCVAKDEREASMLAANAGLDMDMVSRCYINNLEALVKDGSVSEETVNKAAERVIYIKLLFGIMDNPYCTGIEYNAEEHRKAAKASSDEAMVLLKNKNNILPLKKETKVFATGPMLYEKRAFLGSWTLDFDINLVKSPAEVLKESGANVLFPSSEYLWDDCLKKIRREECDTVIVFLGESESTTGEANSLARIELPEEQLALARKLHALGKPVIGVMGFGRPVALEEADDCFDAILYAWHSGTCTAESIVSILYGEVNPSGRLPISFPRCTGQIPIYYNCPNGNSYGESYYKDGRLAVYNDRIAEPMYPFGYGLSYTEFEYKDIYCENEKISYDDIANGKKFKIYATVENIGKRDGFETAQCYIRDCTASMLRPQRELKGFSKEYIEAGGKKQVCFELGFDELAFYNGKAEFKPEKGEFDIYIGKDCYAPKCMTIEII